MKLLIYIRQIFRALGLVWQYISVNQVMVMGRKRKKKKDAMHKLDLCTVHEW